LQETDPATKGSYRLYEYIGSRNWKSGPGPTKGCRATGDDDDDDDDADDDYNNNNNNNNNLTATFLNCRREED
jgi:hypothetical protein